MAIYVTCYVVSINAFACFLRVMPLKWVLSGTRIQVDDCMKRDDEGQQVVKLCSLRDGMRTTKII